MTALQANRDAHEHASGREREYVVKSGSEIFKGALVGLNTSNELQPMAASVTGGLKCLGFALKHIVGDGTKTCPVLAMVGKCHNSSSGDALSPADIGHVVYAADDQTLAKTDASGTRSPAGVLFDFDYDSDKPFVAAGFPYSAGASDLMVVSIDAVSSKASDAASGRFVAPVGMKLVRFYTVINGALATADATVTAKINGTNVTDGVATITQSGSAAGDVDSAVPTAANTLAAGDVLSFLVGGGSTATATLSITAVLQPA